MEGGADLFWQTDTVTMDDVYVQVTGFLDPLHGWTGGFSQLLETNDSGTIWNPLFFGNAHDRFHRVDGSTAYMTGSGIYKYSGPNKALQAPWQRPCPERIAIAPDPVADQARIHITLKAATAVEMELFTADGRWLGLLHQERFAAVDHDLVLDARALATGSYYATLRTSEGHLSAPFLVR